MVGRARSRSLHARVGAVVAVALGAALPLLAPEPALAAPGDLDTRLRRRRRAADRSTAAPSSTPFFVEDIEVLPSGRTIAYGSFPLPGSGSSGILAFTAAGAIDSTWNGGVPIPWDSTWQIPQRTLLVDAAGRVLAREGDVDRSVHRDRGAGCDVGWRWARQPQRALPPRAGSTASRSTTSKPTATRWSWAAPDGGRGQPRVLRAAHRHRRRRQHVRGRRLPRAAQPVATCRVPRRRSSAATSSETPPATST